jgi:MOSC domain-containing protein YiiM
MVDVVAVNVGTPQRLGTTDGARVYSGIAKHPRPSGEVLWLSLVSLSGDGQADLRVHGGRDKAVYAYPSEHLPVWADELGGQLGDAPFGENLSTAGVLEADVRVGDRWRWGSALLQVCQPRWPCFKLTLHRGRPDVGGRMRATGRTGWYLRVLEPGEVVVGEPVEVDAEDPRGVSIRDAHDAMSDRALARRPLVEAVAAHPALASEWREPLEERLARHPA